MISNTDASKHYFKIGIPVDWQIMELQQLCIQPIVYGIVQAGENVDNGIPYIRSTDVGDEIDILKLLKTSIEIALKYNRSSVKPGDIVFSLRGNIGETSIVPATLPKGNLTQGTARISVKEKDVDNKYLRYAIMSRAVHRSIIRLGKGSTFQEISLEELRKIKIPLPTLTEQKAIAHVLSTADNIIQTIEKLIAQKKLGKKWLMQQLLSGKKRLNGFGGEWKFVRFKEIYSQVNQKAGNEKFLVLSVTKDGIVSQAEYFNKEIASEDTSPYLVVRKGDMAMSGLNFWMGSIDVLFEYEIGMVSPAYKVFEIHNPEISGAFMKSFVRSEIMLQCLIGSSVIGASIVRRNLDRETLDEWSFRLPLLEEQTTIAQVLQAADKEIGLLNAKAEKLREQKKGLMQVLLTGKKRLKINE